MYEGQGRGRSHLFTLRLWQEALGEGETEWRGKLQHVLTGEARYFRDWRALMAFLQQTLPGLDARGGGIEQD